MVSLRMLVGVSFSSLHTFDAKSLDKSEMTKAEESESNEMGKCRELDNVRLPSSCTAQKGEKESIDMMRRKDDIGLAIELRRWDKMKCKGVKT